MFGQLRPVVLDRAYLGSLAGLSRRRRRHQQRCRSVGKITGRDDGHEGSARLGVFAWHSARGGGWEKGEKGVAVWAQAETPWPSSEHDMLQIRGLRPPSPEQTGDDIWRKLRQAQPYIYTILALCWIGTTCLTARCKSAKPFAFQVGSGPDSSRTGRGDAPAWR